MKLTSLFVCDYVVYLFEKECVSGFKSLLFTMIAAKER